MPIAFFFFLATPLGLWDLSSPTRDQTWILCSESMESLNTGPPGNSMPVSFLMTSTKCQTLTTTMHISISKLKVENSSLLCSQRIGKKE